MESAMRTIVPALVSIAIVLLAIGGGYFWFDGTPRLPAKTNSLTVGTTTAENAAQGEIVWNFMDAGTGPSGTPRTSVTLTKNGRVYSVGTYDGSCSSVAAGTVGIGGELSDTNELSPRVQCYFAGDGNEIGIFTNNGTMEVKVGELGEGDAETPFFRGNFKTFLTL